MSIATTGTWAEKLAAAGALFSEARQIVADPNAPAERKSRVSDMIADAQAIKASALQLKSIEESAAEIMAHTKASTSLDTQSPPSGEFKSWGEFLYQVWCAGNPQVKRAPDPRLSYFKDRDEDAGVKDMSGQTASAGGALIPVEFQATLLGEVHARSIVRPRATVIPMRRRQLSMPVLDQTGTTANRPHWFGGLQFYWTEEGGTKTPSDPVFRSVDLVARKLVGFTRASDELLDDAAISLDAFLSGPMGFAGGAAWMEDYAFLRGTGAGQPLGILNAPATIEVSRTTAGTVGYVDLVNMLSKFLPSGQGVWLASQSVMADLIQMTGPAGGNAAYLWAGAFQPGGIANRIPGTLLGFPIIFDEKMPAKGYSGDIVLADFSYYLIGDRQSTTVESTKFEAWQEDKTSWRMVHRVDGRPWLSAPFTYEDGVTVCSPFVKLSGVTLS